MLIHAFTDGACTGNPGPAGIGVVLLCGAHRREISEYIGEATNNIAEVTAIVRALSAVKDRSRAVLVRTDSKYAIGMLTQNWKAKANHELIGEARALVASFSNVKFEWVPGHAGVVENERCDELARAAIRGAQPGERAQPRQSALSVE